MKTLKTIVSVAVATLFSMSVSAQNYKAPNLDASGILKGKNGKQIAVVKDGAMTDAMGMKMSEIDAEGNLIDSKTGAKIGKAEKNGNFSYQMKGTKDGRNFTISEPSTGICEVKDENGKTVLLVHENYKMQAACAYHCAQMKKEGKTMKMK